MAQWLRPFADLPDEPGFVLSNHTAAHNVL